MNEAGEYAVFPLTVFDRLFERTTFVTGWLIEGTIDTAALVSALQRVTEKWRMLSGRLQSTEQNNSVQWFLKIPLGRLPHDYATFSLTTSTSTTPLSKYVKIPIPSVSTSLPLDVFLHPSTPKSYTVWESSNHPLTCWNITYFPAASNGGVDYTCIGFARSHGIFDGGGAALVINALVAELNGRDWEVPPLPQAGLNVNPLDDVLARAAQAIQYSTPADAFPAYTVVGPGGVLKLAASHVKERFWAGADRRIILLPKVVLDTLVEEVRSSLRNGQKIVEHVTTGDVLVAWIFKTVYASGTKPQTKIHCTNFANFRTILGSKYAAAQTFPHNAFVPLPYPILTVSDVQSFSLSTLTNLFSASRMSLSMEHVVSGYKLLHNNCFPTPPGADETMTVSNVSASRILAADWSAVGSRRTLCGYRYQATPTDVLFTNAVYISGRLDDESTVLDVTLNKARYDLLSGQVQRLATRIARNQKYSKPEKRGKK